MPRLNIPDSLRYQVGEDARHRCGYCLTAQKVSGAQMHIEHIVPRAAGGASVRENLWLACAWCNSYKGSQTHARDPLTNEMIALFNPRVQVWREHFAWSDDGTQVIGRTAGGRATVMALRLNHAIPVEARRLWVKAGWHPPED
jgi:hypothetical protein